MSLPGRPVKKTFGRAAPKKDKSSELFDQMLASPKKLPTRTSPRKKSSPPQNDQLIKSPPKSPPKSGLISPPPARGLEASDSEGEEDQQPAPLNSQGSLTNQVNKFSLDSPTKKSPPESTTSSPPIPSPNKSISEVKVQELEEDDDDKLFKKPEPKIGKKKPVYKHAYNEEKNEGLEFKDEDHSSKPPEKLKKVDEAPKPKRFFKSKSRNLNSPAGCSSTSNGGNIESESFAPSVIGEVKKATQCLEHGAAQEFKDECIYILQTLSTAESVQVKCLTLMSLARKCLKAEFRQFVGASKVPNRVFYMLSDAHEHHALSMCTALLLYLLARDRYGLLIDSSTLKMILRLISVVPNKEDKQYSKYKSQAWEILSEWKTHTLSTLNDELTNAFVFDVTPANISPNFLVSEALVFISTRRTEDSFKKAMREYGGLQLLVQCVEHEITRISGDVKLDFFEHLKMLQRYLRILENVTTMNEANQIFLISHRNCILIEQCISLLHTCQTQLWDMTSTSLLQAAHQSNSDPVKLLDDCLTSVIRVLCNLSNDNELCCIRLGQSGTFVEDCLSLITFVAPVHIPPELRFDLVVLVAGLLSNVVEHCSENRRKVTESMVPFLENIPSAHEDEVVNAKPIQTPAVEALTKLLLGHMRAAEKADQEMDEHMEKPFQQARKNAVSAGNTALVRMPTQCELKKTVEEALNKAGQHMEDSILASYIALLLGLLVQHSEQVMEKVRSMMPTNKFEPMVEVLTKFVEFMDMADSSEHRKGQKVIARIIDSLQDLDK